MEHEAEDNAIRDMVGKLRQTVHNYKKDYGLRTFRSTKTKTKGKRKRKRSYADDGSQSGNGQGPARDGGSGSVAYQLKAHGYEIVPDTFEDESGGIWERLPLVRLRNRFVSQDLALIFGWQLPPHIRTVYRATDPNRTLLIAKQVREHSSELEVLEFIQTIKPQSPYIISLMEIVSREWLILPKQLPITELHLNVHGAQLRGKLVQYSCDLIKGLGYLHEHGIAHLDIKPRNLVYAKQGPLQIIDFDSAVQVESENEEIEGLCGTRGWRAPEIGNDEEEVGPPPVFSPIRADRWSCGKVLLELVGEVGKGGAVLVKFAKQLMNMDPRRRPSLLDWDGLEGEN